MLVCFVNSVAFHRHPIANVYLFEVFKWLVKLCVSGKGEVLRENLQIYNL